jgi:hypothetical protein
MKQKPYRIFKARDIELLSSQSTSQKKASFTPMHILASKSDEHLFRAVKEIKKTFYVVKQQQTVSKRNAKI